MTMTEHPPRADRGRNICLEGKQVQIAAGISRLSATGESTGTSETGCSDGHGPTCQFELGRRAQGSAGLRPGVPTCTGRRAELCWADVLRALPVRDRVCRRAPADGHGPASRPGAKTGETARQWQRALELLYAMGLVKL